MFAVISFTPVFGTERELRRFLLQDYDSNARPVLQHFNAVNVTANLQLTGIIKLV